ncbi:HypC/HybG/HupF family hydrogenase formation chaperone [Terasakiella sp. A23]|uniref:HypC/HybG/HupF family hydrogenase formation chaperone n=1 Tax=Terasakiella sp. FCG-A23 TaxID=3080561 RepID=UPI002953FB5C|nr:HypC/HybG/HupF family hydrogenase formation chaperone [Terasakiella sp. A23]MDV7340274.1 HypC/HybG/HupF family hydrogenase formation chaperone [Terasakiella sp. A23]
MCIGTPVKVIENRDFTALCEGRNGVVEVNMMLIGPQEEGTWVLSFLGSAREVLTEEDAQNIDSALDGLAAIMNGADEIDVDSYFPDISLEK